MNAEIDPILWNKLESLLEELIQGQEKNSLACAKRIVPQVTQEDLLQPNDFIELEEAPHFRYEEGVLAGMLTVKAALLSLKMNRLGV